MTDFIIGVNKGEKARIDKGVRNISTKARGVAAVLGSKEMAKEVMKEARRRAPSRRIKENFYLGKKGKSWAVVNRHFLAHLFEFGTMGQGPSETHFFRNAVSSAGNMAAKKAQKKMRKIFFEETK